MAEITFPLEIRAPRRHPRRIYQLRAPAVSERSVYSLAERFGLPTSRRARLSQDSTSLSYAVESQVVQVYRASGGVRYHDERRWLVDQGGSLEIEDGEADRLARAVVDRLQLVPPDDVRLLKVTRLRAGDVEVATGEGTERVIDVGVVYQRLIDGVPVEGPGGTMVVYLDSDRELAGVDRLWRDVSGVYRESPELRPWRQVQGLVARRLQTERARVTVTEARLGYWELGWTVAQRFLQPAYVLEMERPAMQGRSIMRATWVTAASQNPVGTLDPPRRTRREQPVRG